MRNMKKMFLFGIVIFILLFGIVSVSAANESFNATALSDTHIQKTTNDALGKEIKLSPALQNIARVVFGLKSGESIDVSDFIALVGLWIILVVLIHEGVGFIPIFEKEALAWAVSIIITLIIALSGAIKSMANLLFKIANDIKAISGWAVFKLILVLFILTLLSIGLHMILKMLKDKIKEEENRNAGFRVGTGNISRT